MFNDLTVVGHRFLDLFGIFCAKNVKAVELTDSSSKQQKQTIQQALSLAMDHHTAGRFTEAEAVYQQILQADPNHPDALHLLGLIAYQAGKHDDALDLIKKSISTRPGFANAHNSLGLVLNRLGKLDEAVATYGKALAIKPDTAEVHFNLGNAFNELWRLDEAVASYRKAIAIKPDYADALNNLGISLQDLGCPDEAVSSYQQALAIKPDAETHYNLGNSLKELRRLDEAATSYRNALAISPDLAEAYSNLGVALQDLGQAEEALSCHRHAVALKPRNGLIYTQFAKFLETFSFTNVDDDLWQTLSNLLERPTVHPPYLTKSIIRALRHHSDFSQILELTSAKRPETEIAYQDVAERLSTIPPFIRIMGLSSINDLNIEQMLTFLRHAMIKGLEAGKTDEKGLPFSAALALQCFTNEYVFSETDEEKAAVENLHQQIAELLEKARDISPNLVATLGAYRPLYSFSWARELCERAWDGCIKEVIERQILEPLEEQSLISRIPRLTPIQNVISSSVREQYEENPYPRWVKTGLLDKRRAIGAVLQAAPLRLDLGDYQSPESPEILVAGCGTGRHAITTASRFSNARVLALDLSLNSLSYALRKTNEIGFSDIEYVQGDIMELGSLGRQFDLIESVGVLHHLGDPLAGWRILVDLLRPGGLMRIGLYNEIDRQNIVCGHDLITEKGYTTSPEDIRRCRESIIAMGEDGNQMMAEIYDIKDFFSLSECRDLLFHVQEHRFTLPQIEAALKSLKLEFLGFDMRDQKVLRKFEETHPCKRSLTSLPQWHEFELQHPGTLTGMYIFWCRK